MMINFVVVLGLLAGCAHGACPRDCLNKINNKFADLAVNGIETGSGGGRPGAVYTRWGRKSCPDKNKILYEGFAAGSFYSHAGGGANYLCMPKEPEFAEVQANAQGCGGYMYGAEYEVCPNNVFTKANPNAPSIHDNDVPCAVCQAKARPAHVMIPARTSCPKGWTKEYQGFIMGSHHGHSRTQWVCVDSAPESRATGHTNVNGALFYLAEVKCGALPCPPYQDGSEIACVVCTK